VWALSGRVAWPALEGYESKALLKARIALKGLLVIGETGKVTCENIRAANVIVAGAVKGNITAQKVEIRSSGRVWGDIITTAFGHRRRGLPSGQIRMEDAVDLDLDDHSGIPTAPEQTQPVKV